MEFEQVMAQIEAGLDKEEIGQSILDDHRASANRSSDIADDRRDSGPFELRGLAMAGSDDFELMDGVPIWDQATHARMMSEIQGQKRALEFRENKAQAALSAVRGDKTFAQANLVHAETRVIQEKTANQGHMLNQVIEAGLLIQAQTSQIVAERGLVEVRTRVKTEQAQLEAQKGQALLKGIVLETEQMYARNDQLLLQSQTAFADLKGAGINGSYKPL